MKYFTGKNCVMLGDVASVPLAMPDGSILLPAIITTLDAAGKVYKAKVRVDEGGKKLLVRGFIGISLLGRSQTWTREP